MEGPPRTLLEAGILNYYALASVIERIQASDVCTRTSVWVPDSFLSEQLPAYRLSAAYSVLQQCVC